MKPKLSLSSLLLMSTVLLSPSLAAAQEPTVADEIVVRGRNIPEPQRATAQVATFLSADDLKRTGDDNAALALTRLSGLSLVGGRFAYVRGLGERYSAARLNGSPLPSPEPLKRTVPLDLFPSNILGGATVQKTFSVDYPGEFGGGIIDLQTLRDPGESFLNVKLGVNMNTVTSGHDGIYVRGGDLDWLGFDDGLRSLPDPLQAVIDSKTRLENLSDAEVEALGESFVNSPLSVIQTGTIGPNFEGEIEGGLSHDLSDGLTLGLVGVAGYRQDWTTENSIRQFVFGQTVGRDFEVTETSLNAVVNALGSGSLTWDDHEVQATLLYIHDGRKEAQTADGTDFDTPAGTGTQRVLDETTSFLERQLAMAQLSGEHALGDFEVNWRGAFARSTRESPYERSLRRHFDTDGNVLYSEANQYSILFSDLTDDSLSGGIDFIYNLPISGAREVILSAGYDYSDNERDAVVLPFRFRGGNSLPLDVQLARPDFLFSPDNIDPDRFELVDDTSSGSDSYTGDLIVRAAYAQADLELIPTVRTTVGVRYEDATQKVDTSDRFEETPGQSARLANDYWLPSATVTWNFTDNMQFRLGYSHTVARPQFRELAPSLFLDPETDRSYRGSRYLVDSEFRNYDARYEYYLGRNQFFTVAGFLKKIENPIEEILFSRATATFPTTFINSPEAQLYGGEAEYRTRFAIDWNDWFESREWLFSVNYTYTHSEIKAEEGDKVIDPFSVDGTQLEAVAFGLDGAKMQGTPEHIVNTQFGWEGENDQFTILLGWVDSRILQRGSPLQGVPDVIESPGIQLDAVFNQDIVIAGTGVTLGLSARNLLGTDHEEYQLSDVTEDGRTEFDTYKRGRSLSASVTARF